MTKTTISTEQDYDNQPVIKSTTETDAVSLDELLRVFEDHLRGCGFCFDGHLEIVNEEITH